MEPTSEKLLDRVRVCTELVEVTPFASNTIPSARSSPTSTGSNVTSFSTTSGTRTRWALPRSKPS